MKRNILIGGLLLTLGVLVMGCFPEDELTFTGKEIEFKNHTIMWGSAVATARGIATTGQSDSARTVQEVTRVRDTIYVQMVGKQQATATEVSFQVRNTSTAIHGTHYNFNAANSYDVASNVGTVTIPANSSVGYLILDLIDAQAVGATVRVDILLTEADGFTISPNYHKFKVTIRGN